MSPTKLNEHTLVSIGFVGAVAGGLLTGVVFVASLGFSSSQHEKDIAQLRSVFDERRKADVEYETRVAHEIASLKADISIVDTRVQYLSQSVERAIVQSAQAQKRKKGDE